MNLLRSSKRVIVISVSVMLHCIFWSSHARFSSFHDILQDGSEWLFTNKKTDEAHPFTMHVNFEKFSDGLQMNRLSLLAVHTEF